MQSSIQPRDFKSRPELLKVFLSLKERGLLNHSAVFEAFVLEKFANAPEDVSAIRGRQLFSWNQRRLAKRNTEKNIQEEKELRLYKVLAQTDKVRIKCSMKNLSQRN